MVGLSQYSQLPVPVLLYTSCHILSVNTECQTYFPRKRITYSKYKHIVHQHFMSSTILEVKPSLPSKLTSMYTSINIRGIAINIPLIQYCGTICASLRNWQIFRLICTYDLPDSWRSIVNLTLISINTAL